MLVHFQLKLRKLIEFIQIVKLFSTATCNYHGIVHHLGTSFDAIDGCNICFCKKHGVSCTEKACMNAPPGKLN